MLNPGELDLNLEIRVYDLGVPSLSSKIVAKIIVKDVNDNQPKFEKIFYSTRLLETTKFGDVFQVKAVDADSPNTFNSKIIYSIDAGNDKEKFLIDSHSGIVRVVENSDLDRDLFGSFYTLKIIASDLASISKNRKNESRSNSKEMSPNSNSSTTTDLAVAGGVEPKKKIKLNICYLFIEIVDVNNKKPEFSNLNLKYVN
jgi:hypothetical protein